jgi:hypothetical protein
MNNERRWPTISRRRGFQLRSSARCLCPLEGGPIATMAPLWEALAARCERGEPEAPRYFHCRHEMLAVAAASGYHKATGRAQAVFLPTGFGVLHGAMALRTALQERTPMTVVSPDTLTPVLSSPQGSIDKFSLEMAVR